MRSFRLEIEHGLANSSQVKEENTTKDLRLDLVRSHASTKARKTHVEEEDDKLEVNDIISGKGKGLIILLYGKKQPNSCRYSLW